jgi:CheY-like chemotaxis protein
LSAFRDRSRFAPDYEAGGFMGGIPESTPRAKTVGGATQSARRATVPMPPPRILLADRDAAVRNQIKPILRGLHAEVSETDSGEHLEAILRQEGPFDLVITNAQLPTQSGLQVLARCRAVGVRTPFIVITSVHQLLLRVFVSDAEGTVLSSRMVDGDNLATLAENLIENGSGPASSRGG